MCMCFVFLPTLMKMHLSRPDLSVMTSTLNKSIKNYINSVKISSRAHKVWLLTRQAIIISMLISRNAVRRDKKWNHLNLKVCLLPRSPSVSWFSHLSLSPPPPLFHYCIMGCIIRISADSITLLPRLHRTVSDTALLCARWVLSDAAGETKPAELKKTGGEQRQTDVLKRGLHVCCVVSGGLKWSHSQRGACMWGLRRRRKRG